MQDAWGIRFLLNMTYHLLTTIFSSDRCGGVYTENRSGWHSMYTRKLVINTVSLRNTMKVFNLNSHNISLETKYMDMPFNFIKNLIFLLNILSPCLQMLILYAISHIVMIRGQSSELFKEYQIKSTNRSELIP